MTKKMTAEFIGTLALVFFGCGAVVLAGFGVVGQLGIAFAFGLAVVAMAYCVGPISGAHLNPAVSIALWIAGVTKRADLPGYIAAQCAGAIVGAGILYLIAGGGVDYDIRRDGLGQNGYGLGYGGEYNLVACAVFEVAATFLFTATIIGVTQARGFAAVGGLVIGLTLAVIHIVGIQVTGVSVNPARSLGPAVWVGGRALGDLWLFAVAPLVGAGLAGWAFRAKLLSEEET